MARLRRQDDQNRDMVLAWHTAALTRVEKMPKLETLLQLPKRRQTLAEQREVIRLLSKRYGIPLREKVH